MIPRCRATHPVSVRPDRGGGGINGAGIARDAAMRGPRILVLDKGDISSGTTQWPTRLIHGGLRYLERYEVCAVCSPRGFSCEPVS